MKILHLSSEYPPAKVYGLGRFVHGLARAQAAAGDDVSVLTNSTGGAEDDVLLDGVRLHRIAFPNPPRPADGHGEVLQFNHGLVSRFLDRRESFAGVEVVASHDWLTALAAREIAQELNAPLVVTFHDEVVGKHFGNLDTQARFVRDLEALTAHDATRVIANSEFIQEQVVRHYGVPRDRVVAVHGGIDPALLRVSDEARVADFRSVLASEDAVFVAYVGRFDQEKGLGTLAEAALLAAQERPELCFAFAGSGREEGALRDRLAPLGARARVLGYVSGESLSYLYRAADVVVVPSLYEPLGLVALEAMLANSAVVVSRVGGLTEIVKHEEHGLVVPPGDAVALSQALVRLAEEGPLRERLGRHGSQRARDTFSWEKAALATRTVYAAAIQDRRDVCALFPRETTRPPVSILVATDADAVTVRRRTDYPNLRIVRSLDEVEAGELVCQLAAGVTIPAESTGWLSSLVWVLETLGGDSASPTFDSGEGALRRRARRDERGFLARHDPRSPAPDGAIHWTSPVRLHFASELDASIVVVAYNNIALTRIALEAVIEHTPEPFELVLVDNGSSDGTREYFRELEERLLACRVIENAENLGYTKAANQGIRASRGRNVVLLNNDTRVRPGWLTTLLEAVQSSPSVGVVTPKILNLDGTVQNAGGILHHTDGSFTIPHANEDRLAPPISERRSLENAGGPCMLLTRALIADLRGFDEVFSPGYFEDSDLCLRAREEGFRLLYEPRSEVFHHGKATASLVAAEGKLEIWKRFEENKRLFYKRWSERLELDDLLRRSQELASEQSKRIVLWRDRECSEEAVPFEDALRQLGHEVVVAGPCQQLDLGPATAAELVRAAGGADLLLVVEGGSGAPEDLRSSPCPTALWVEGTVAPAGARSFDAVFVAQRDHLPRFTDSGIKAHWLPHACDPTIYRGHAVVRDLDVVVTGGRVPADERRRSLLDRLRKSFRVAEHRNASGTEAARLYSRAKVVFHCSRQGELDRQVFETLACGSLLVTDRIENGLDQLLGDGEHLGLYDDRSLENVVGFYLTNTAPRDAVAARGQRLVTTHHTYEQRMRQLVRIASEARKTRATASGVAR